MLLALALAAVWWVRSPDPEAGLRRLTDPATYTDLAERLEGLFAGRRVTVEGGEPGVSLIGPGGVPTAGFEESGDRLAPAVDVADPDPAHRFAVLQDDGVTPVAWSPCRPLHYVVASAGAPDGFAETVAQVAAEISGLTGLVLVDDGTTDEVPSAAREAFLPERYGDRWAPVLVAVAEPASVPMLDGDIAGVTYTYRARGGTSGTWHITSGAVYVDAAALTFPRVADGEQGWVPVLRHEMGHLVGLDHVDDPGQLMNPVTSTLRTFQAGDRTGLAILGQGACAPDL